MAVDTSRLPETEKLTLLNTLLAAQDCLVSPLVLKHLTTEQKLELCDLLAKNVENTLTTDAWKDLPKPENDRITGRIQDPLKNGLLRQTLDAMHLTYEYVDETVGYHIHYTSDTGIGIDLHILLSTIGDLGKQLLKLLAVIPECIRRENWKEALFFCNEYAQKTGFGPVFLEHTEEEAEAYLKYIANLPVTASLDEDLLKAFLQLYSKDARRFFALARRFGLYR